MQTCRHLQEKIGIGILPDLAEPSQCYVLESCCFCLRKNMRFPSIPFHYTVHTSKCLNNILLRETLLEDGSKCLFH